MKIKKLPDTDTPPNPPPINIFFLTFIFIISMILVHEVGVREGVSQHKRSLNIDLGMVRDEVRLGLGNDRLGALRLEKYLTTIINK